ncbi:hypothetical protein NP493_390g01007 [Ridgeia piscesae]|uniref:Cytoplasmic dynein 1 intermediate chain 2 n=1 Tax=Ridgeia piscesae TaxID=27915 RepID=A0AAD9L1E6_RIDPI|nr:hypothetical protein NP493_390g01007 [Ridgeia piscesae]
MRSQADQVLEELGIPMADASPKHTVKPAAVPAPATVGLPATAPVQALPARGGRKVQLSTSKITQTNIPPRENVSYSKETQTPVEQMDALTYVDLDDDDSMEVAMETPSPPFDIPKMPHSEMVKPADTPEDHQGAKEEKPAPVRVLEDNEVDAILKSDDFQRFFDKTSRIVERILFEEEEDNPFVDYTGTDAEKNDRGLAEGEMLKLNRVFFDEHWSKHRTVTCMDWSSQYPELLVASYNNNAESPHEPDGVALVWNIKYKKTTPEFVFHCQSAVMSTCFAKFHPNLIIGGTYSGQIVLWDNRSNKRTPVQRTPLSAAAHTHPVYCVNVVGTQNAHNLISVSTDGKMCSWSLDMLSQPQDSMELQHKQSKPVAVTSFSFLANDVNNFVVGSEEGAVYTACRHGSKAGIADMFEGHQGPVTGIDCNTVPGQIEFSPYFLTSSFDWTVKLWNMKENRPLHSFEDNSDYVYDVKWSPVHPALFASVNGMARIDLWNLNTDIEVPTASAVVEGNVALNKCSWHSSGQQIAVGDDHGHIHIYNVGELLATPRNDEWTKFVHTLQEIKNNQADLDDEQSSFISMSSPMR